jgi:hypothetical protein
MFIEINGKWIFNKNILLSSLPPESIGFVIYVKNWNFVPDGHPTNVLACLTIYSENISFVTEVGYTGVLYENGAWAEGYDRVVELEHWTVTPDNWFTQNATKIGEPAFAPTITYKDTVIPLELGKATTLHTSGQKLTEDVVINTGKDSIIGTWLLNKKLVQDKLEPNTRYRLLCKVIEPSDYAYLNAFIMCNDMEDMQFSGLGVNLREGYMPELDGEFGFHHVFLGDINESCAYQIDVLSDEADEEAKSWLKANGTKQ